MEVIKGAKNGVAFTFVIPLFDTANPGKYKAAPALIIGDIKVARYTSSAWAVSDVIMANVNPITGMTTHLEVELTATEMAADDDTRPIVITFIDAAGAQWDDQTVEIRLGPMEASLEDTDATKLVIAKAMKDQDVGGTSAVGDSVVEHRDSFNQAIYDVANATGGAVSGIDIKIGTPVNLGDGATLAEMGTAIAGKTADAGSYNRADDSQEAIRDRGDAAWVTGGDATAATQAQIKAKTDNLPADPASETNVDAEAAVLAAEHAALSGEHTSILADTGPILADTADMQPKIGTPAVDLSADIGTKLEDADARDLLFNRDVVTRHANQKPSQYTAGTGVNQETVNTTQDGSGNTETETKV